MPASSRVWLCVWSALATLVSPSHLPKSQKNLLRRSVVSGISTLSAFVALSSIKQPTLANECACLNPQTNCLRCIAKDIIASSTPCICSSNYCLSCNSNSYPIQYVSNDAYLLNSWYNPSNERIYDVKKKSYLPVNHINVLQKELNGRSIVSIGEVHSNPCHHRVEFEVIKSLAQTRNPKDIQIGLECFYRQHQNALDDYVFNHNDFAILKSQTKWDNTWGYDLNQYAKIFNYACQHKIRLVGLNVPYPVVQLVSRYGLSNLPSELRTLLPTVDTSNTLHRAQFMRLVGAHGNSVNDDVLDRMYQSQCLWDEYMADSVIKTHDIRNKNSLFVLIAGIGHILGRSGIPDRIAKRTRHSPFVIVPQEVAWSDDTGLPELDSPLTATDCDWAWYTEIELRRSA